MIQDIDRTPTFVWGRLAALCSILTGFLPVASAQQSLQAAGGTTSIVTQDFSSISVDTTDTAITYTDVRGVSSDNVWQNNMKVTFAAQKGQRAFLSGGNFDPGLELLDRLIYVRNRKMSPNTNRDPGGFWAAFVSGGIDVTLNKLADYADVGQTQINLDQEVAKTLKVGLGFNLAPSESWVFGVSGVYLRNWSVPIKSKTNTVCVQEAQGADGNNQPVTVSTCSERYFGGVSDDYGGQFRFDVVGPRKSLLKIPDAPTKETLPPTIGAIAAVSSNSREGKKPQYNVAVGPAIYRGGNPNQIVGALLVGMDDFTNGSGEVPDVSDRLAISLYIGVPFK